MAVSGSLSQKIKTLDSFFSLEPAELRDLINNIRMVEDALGKKYYGLTSGQKKSRVFRRSLFAVKDIKKAEKFTEENVRSIRPANGIEPKYLKTILKKIAKRFIESLSDIYSLIKDSLSIVRF